MVPGETIPTGAIITPAAVTTVPTSVAPSSLAPVVPAALPASAPATVTQPEPVRMLQAPAAHMGNVSSPTLAGWNPSGSYGLSSMYAVEQDVHVAMGACGHTGE